VVAGIILTKERIREMIESIQQTGLVIFFLSWFLIYIDSSEDYGIIQDILTVSLLTSVFVVVVTTLIRVWS